MSKSLCILNLFDFHTNSHCLFKNKQAYVYKGDKGDCAAFLVNADRANDAAVQFQNGTYKIPRKSISILPDCKTEAFNTAKVCIRLNTLCNKLKLINLFVV